ncbi:MAG TPA: carboxypeptidase-like regulatory domain-containing protein [Terracidiphilus sp.]|nr:carboxypeptidase-like regulatory domain-containing protein [Terracidiphilus sp.]
MQRRQGSARSLLLIALIALFSISLQARAQDVAAISGVVTDQTGAVVPEASVTLRSATTGLTYTTVTNSVGSYTISSVAPGPGYSITFVAQGFKPVEVSGLYLNVNITRTQNAQLSVGAQSQTVEVSASAETVTLNTSDATVGNNFQVQFLNDLPVANRDSPAALFTQQPGVTLDGAVTGARVDQNNVTLDGLDVNDMATGDFGAIVGSAPVDSVQEFRGVTAGPLASAGEGGGGQYELVTRSGTNSYHGALVEYHRDTNTEANSWFNNNSGVPRPPLIRNQFGGNIGGPIRRDKAFFFFDWNSRRDTLSNLVRRVVPTDAFRNGSLSYLNDSGGVSTLTSAQVAQLDPQGIGFNSALQTVMTSRLPEPNDLSAGVCDSTIGACSDGINTGALRFNAPFPYLENDYVGRVDYNLTGTQKLFGRVSFARVTGTQDPIQFPGDPQTFPFLDKSHGWVVGHSMTIGNNKTNRASFGETVTNYNFPNSFNPTGITQYAYGFGGDGAGGSILTGPYASAVNAQNRIYPIPVARDDFSWLKGNHTLQFGGTFKYINPDSNTILDYNLPTIGLGGNIPNLDSSLRPSDISSDSVAESLYDGAFAFALGRYADVSSTFNYNAQGNLVPQGTGSRANYRYYETEIYFGDTWKVTPSLTLSYGLRWQNYSVPYEKNGIESVPTLDFNQLFDARVKQSAAGISGDDAVPFVSYILGGKANNAPGYFEPVYKNFAPRFAFAYSPGFSRNTVWSGGAGIIYDHTVVNAIQYQAAQYSYLFQASATDPYGISGNPTGSLMTDPRFSGLDSPPPAPTAPTALQSPYTPFVDNGVPFGLANGQAFNEGVDRNLKTPYSIQYNFGVQHEFGGGLILKTNYVGRLGRRLLGQADANQLIDFPDAQSNQMMSEAFGALSTELRNGVDPLNVTPQPWFEDVMFPGAYTFFGVPSNTAIISYYLGTLAYRGDFADTIQVLAGAGLLQSNVGMGSQFSEFTYYTNKGFSSYNGLLATLHKNVSHGLQFDLNYTWSHSIDNVSVIANAPAIGGYGFICDVLRPRECRGNSDFDVTQYLNGNFIYELPFGHGKAVGATTPFWVNEVIGGWSLSGLPSWHTGTPYFATTLAFVAGYANNAPAILTGNASLLNMDIHKGADGRLYGFTDPNAAANAYTGPVGFKIGARNNLRGPRYFNIDLGLGKTFPLYQDKVNLKFRADAFNALNHPNFDNPNTDLTSSGFGRITGTAHSARVLQGALRLEF